MAGPILMPGMFSSPEGMARMWAPMSLVIIGGLTMSTFLTLLVIPCIYTIVDDFSVSIKRVFVKSK
jgi:multidrug efflux pump subunit AcrB